MAIEDTAYCVGNRFVEVVPFDQNGKEPGDGTSMKCTRSFEDLGKHAEHRGRVALLTGGFASRETDFALGHRQPCDGIHNQQYVCTLVTKVFSSGKGNVAGPNPERSGTVGCCDNHNGTLLPFWTEFVLQKAANFPITLAD